MSDLAEWLLACIADDEQVALACTYPRWRSWVEGRDGFAGDSSLFLNRDPGDFVADLDVTGLPPAEQDHAARQDPAATLARCAAHRAIIVAYGATRQRARSDAPPHGRGWNYCDGNTIAVDGKTLRGAAAAQFIELWYEDCPPDPAILALALAYADRPGYREEWRP